RGEGRTRERARLGARGTQVRLCAQRRVSLDARAQGRARPRGGSRDGLQLERLHGAALGRAGQERRGRNLPAARAVDAARENDRLSELVPRAAPPAARLARSSRLDLLPLPPNSGLPEFGTLTRP